MLTLPPIVPLGTAAAPLSYQQEVFWEALQHHAVGYRRTAEGGFVANTYGGVRIRGSADLAAVQRAVDGVVRRHHALRTRFDLVDGRWMQRVVDVPSVAVHHTRVTGRSPAARETALLAAATAAALEPFDVAAGVMLRVTVFRLAAAEHVVFVVVPHIVSDMGTIQIVIHDLLVLYLHFAAGRPSPLPERPLQYADFVHWQRDWVQGDLRRTVGEYLERQWRGSRAVTLPVDHVQPAGPRNPDGGKYLFSLAPALATQLREVSRQFRVTPFMVVLGVFSLVVAAWAEQDDVSMVVPFAGRPGTDGSGIVGLFSNPCPVRVDVGGDPTFADVLERSRVAVADAWSYRCVPYAVLSDVATAHGGLPRPTIGMNCLIDVGRLVPADCADLVPIGTDITPFVLEIDACRAVRQTRGDLNLWVRFEPNASVTMTFIYRLAAFERETMAAAAGTLTRCLETCLADPTCRRSIAV